MTSLGVRDAMILCEKTSDIDVIIELTKHENARVRKRALKEICPCRVKSDIDEFWLRVFAMVDDPDDEVRKQVLHTVCDGSPLHLEDEVMNTVLRFNNDSNATIRRTAHKVLATYRSKGKWNIL